MTRTAYAYNAFQDHAELTAHDDVEWADPGMALPTDRYWPRAEVAPPPGADTLVRAFAESRHAAAGDEPWLLFQPALAAVNGWTDYPDAIVDSAFVRSRVRAVERPDPSRGQWLRVEVMEVLRLDDLEKRFPARRLPRLETWRLSTGSLTRYQDWELWFAPHDDAGHWLLARLEQDEAHVVAAGEWLCGAKTDYHKAWAGHVVLPLEAWREEVCQRS